MQDRTLFWKKEIILPTFLHFFSNGRWKVNMFFNFNIKYVALLIQKYPINAKIRIFQ